LHRGVASSVSVETLRRERAVIGLGAGTREIRQQICAIGWRERRKR
jgi:hypothetical protein